MNQGVSNEGAKLGDKDETGINDFPLDKTVAANLNDNLEMTLVKLDEVVTGVVGLEDSDNEVLSDEEGAIKGMHEMDEERDEEDTRCGLGSFHPSWLQWFASKKSYVCIYGMIGMMDHATGSHLVAILSTLEKRFKISSRTSGIIASGWDIGGLLCNLTFAYIGSRGHKTRYVSAGILLVSLSCFTLYTMHVVYGPGQDALQLTVEYGANLNSSNYTYTADEGAVLRLCGEKYQTAEDCSGGSETSILPSIILLLSQIIPGAGLSMYYTLGFAYLDDNARKDKAPFLLAMMQFIRLLGPTVGYMLASHGLSLYVDPSLHPVITPEDPRWIGAWWFGWIPIGIVTLFLSVALALFPKTLPRAAKREQQKGSKRKQPPPAVSFSDFKEVLRRMLKNKVLMYNSFSSVCFTFGIVGYWAFTPKYMETIFQKTAPDASFITGAVGLTCTAFGILSSGAVITLFKPRPRYLAMWNVIAELLESIGHFSYGFIACGSDTVQGSPGLDNSWNLTASCNENCFCGPTVEYSPVCALEGNLTYYSPCHAGCTIVNMINGTKMFGNCSCVGDGTGWVVDGECFVDCASSFTLFIVVQSILRFLSASGRAGNMIISFRCVDQDDKSVSIGFTLMLLCALALIPAPILYGVLLDMACTVWGQVCGTTGNCWLYDAQYIRFLMNFTSSGFLLAGTLFDVGVWYYVKDLQMYEDP